ncbi:transcription elongation factor TFIIS-like protein [Tanacetum coccineum]
MIKACRAIEIVSLSDKRDSWKWSLDGSNGFSVASVRDLVDSHILDVDLVATRWNRSIPIKINVFLCRLKLNRLPSRVNLDRKGIDVGSILCPTCHDDVETVNHIFFNCGMAKDLWALLAKWWELDIPICANISEWYDWLDSLSVSSKVCLFLEGAGGGGGTLLWTIWNYRNHLLFSSSPPKKSVLWDSIVSQSFLWISSRNPKFNFRELKIERRIVIDIDGLFWGKGNSTATVVLCGGSDNVDDANAADPYRVAVSVESAMFEKWGRSNGAQKLKYMSIMFNIKDPKNPDFRRKVLLGYVKPERILELTPEEMVSTERQMEIGKIKWKALFDCERGLPPKATTDEFRCGRCGKRKCTYYQLQTRSADEPMMTFVTCVNYDNHWKFY